MERYLKAKVFFVGTLKRFKIIPNIWYKCEDDYNNIRIKELIALLKSSHPQEAHND